MKKNFIVSTLVVMSFMVITPAMMQASDEEMAVLMVASAPEPVKKAKSPCGTHQAKTKSDAAKNKKSKYSGSKNSKSGKACMHKIERDLDQIREDFKANGDVETANAKLDKIPARIDAAVAKMKKSEVHGSMWQRHEHKLNSKLELIRTFVNK